MKITTIYITDDQSTNLKKIAKRRGGQKVSELIRTAIDLLIEKYNNETV